MQNIEDLTHGELNSVYLELGKLITQVGHLHESVEDFKKEMREIQHKMSMGKGVVLFLTFGASLGIVTGVHNIFNIFFK